MASSAAVRVVGRSPSTARRPRVAEGLRHLRLAGLRPFGPGRPADDQHDRGDADPAIAAEQREQLVAADRVGDLVDETVGIAQISGPSPRTLPLLPRSPVTGQGLRWAPHAGPARHFLALPSEIFRGARGAAPSPGATPRSAQPRRSLGRDVFLFRPAAATASHSARRGPAAPRGGPPRRSGRPPAPRSGRHRQWSTAGARW